MRDEIFSMIRSYVTGDRTELINPDFSDNDLIDQFNNLIKKGYEVEQKDLDLLADKKSLNYVAGQCCGCKATVKEYCTCVNGFRSSICDTLYPSPHGRIFSNTGKLYFIDGNDNRHLRFNEKLLVTYLNAKEDRVGSNPIFPGYVAMLNEYPLGHKNHGFTHEYFAFEDDLDALDNINEIGKVTVWLADHQLCGNIPEPRLEFYVNSIGYINVRRKDFSYSPKVEGNERDE